MKNNYKLILRKTTQKLYKIKEWLKSHLIKPERLKGECLHKILGDRIFERDIWQFSRCSVSSGLALGLFIAFTPTIPLQMLLSAVCAIWLRVNLPIAVTACWVTNPFTVVWIYFMEHRLGQAVMGKMPGIFVVSDLENIGAIRKLFSHATYLWTGGIIFGAITAMIAYFAIRITWNLLSRS